MQADNFSLLYVIAVSSLSLVSMTPSAIYLSFPFFFLEQRVRVIPTAYDCILML